VVEATFRNAYAIALRAARARAVSAVASGAIAVADREDLEQEAVVACFRALPRFDPSRASLRTFIERVVATFATGMKSIIVTVGFPSEGSVMRYR